MSTDSKPHICRISPGELLPVHLPGCTLNARTGVPGIDLRSSDQHEGLPSWRLLPSREGPGTEGLAPAMHLDSVGFVLGRRWGGGGAEKRQSGTVSHGKAGAAQKEGEGER